MECNLDAFSIIDAFDTIESDKLIFGENELIPKIILYCIIRCVLILILPSNFVFSTKPLRLLIYYLNTGFLSYRKRKRRIHEETSNTK
jgi:hypothetical protein